MMTDNRTTTLYVVAYDISADKRRTKVHKILCGYGQWTQFSLFECFLSERQFVALRARLDRVLNIEKDSVRFYPLCGSCQKKVETVGSPKPQEPDLFLI